MRIQVQNQLSFPERANPLCISINSGASGLIATSRPVWEPNVRRRENNAPSGNSWRSVCTIRSVLNPYGKDFKTKELV